MHADPVGVDFVRIGGVGGRVWSRKTCVRTLLSREAAGWGWRWVGGGLVVRWSDFRMADATS
jgi:hypothetical protein